MSLVDSVMNFKFFDINPILTALFMSASSGQYFLISVNILRYCPNKQLVYRLLPELTLFVDSLYFLTRDDEMEKHFLSPAF